MTPFLYLRSVTCTRSCCATSSRRRAATAPRRCSRRGTGGPEDVLVFGHDSLDLFAWRSSTGEFQVLDLVPRDVLKTLPSFDALMGVALGRCLNS